MYISESHGYFYQVQTQMHVTNLKWCDSQELFVQRIWYNSVFMKEAFLILF